MKIKQYIRKIFHKDKRVNDSCPQNAIRVNRNDYARLSLHIEGKNNLISIQKIQGNGKIDLHIYGSNNRDEKAPFLKILFYPLALFSVTKPYMPRNQPKIIAFGQAIPPKR